MALAALHCGGGEPPAGGPQPLAAIGCEEPQGSSVTFCLANAEAGIVDPRNDFYGSGVVLFDADGDADLDLFAGGDAFPSVFWRNDGTGKFRDDTAAVGLGGLLGVHGVIAADYDNDGDRDLYVTRQTDNQLFRNDGGAFVDVTAAAGVGDSRWGGTAAFGDYDGDGLLDLYVGNWADYLGTSDPEPNVLYRNAGNGGFVDVTEQAGAGGARFTNAVAMSDIDGDGDVDLLEANDFGVLGPRTRVFRNEAGTLTDIAPAVRLDLPIFTMNLASADYDRDGDLDYYLTNVGCNVLAEAVPGGFDDVARARGAGVCDVDDPSVAHVFESADPDSPDADERAIADFQARYVADGSRPGLTGWAGIFLDFDHDGWEDLFVANGQIRNEPRFYGDAWLQPNALLHSTSDGAGGRRFDDIAASAGVASAQGSRGATSGDLDGDGDLDLVVSQLDYSGPPVPSVLVYRNQGARGNWLIVELEGGADGLTPNGGANRDGIGARVELEVAGEPVQVRERIGGGGYLGPPAAQLHVGLGAAVVVDTVVVRWPPPSTIIDRCTNVSANQVLHVREGSCP